MILFLKISFGHSLRVTILIFGIGRWYWSWWWCLGMAKQVSLTRFDPSCALAYKVRVELTRPAIKK